MKRIIFTLTLILFLLPGLCLAQDLTRETQTLLLKTQDTVIHAEREFSKKHSVSADFKALKALAEELRVNNLLLKDRFETRKQNVNTLGPKAIDRHQAMVHKYDQTVQQLLGLLDTLQKEKDLTKDNIAKLKTLLENIAPKRPNPIFGSLPYRHLNYALKAPLSGTTIVPAHKGGDKIVRDDDLADTQLAPISRTIAEKAQELKWNPVSIYEWVKNNVESEWYWGVQKGAEETLRQRSGNDADQACLFIALLRASGFPCRYVRGTIELLPDLNRVKYLTGIENEQDLLAFFRKAGIPAKTVIAGGKIQNIRIEHIWVESQIPYANYRGAVIDTMGKTWLGLDTHIKVKGWDIKTPKPWPEALHLNNIRDQYLSQVQTKTPLEYLQETINTWLTQNQPGTSYQDFVETRTLLSEIMNILPGSLQFITVSVTNEYEDLPDEMIHKVRFKAMSPDQTTFFDKTLPAWQLTNNKVTLTYEPETIEDQEIVNSYGGLDNTPAYLVRLRPVLKVNGERTIIGEAGLPMGSEYVLDLDIISPNSTEKISNTHIMGNLAVIGIVSQQAIAPTELPQEEQDAAYLLHKEALNYIKRWNQAEEELSSLLKLALIRPIPTVLTLGGVIEVDYLLDQPHEFTFKGIFMDADLRSVELVPNSSFSLQPSAFLQLSSLQGSVLENKVIEDDFGIQCISTAKLFQTINQQTPNQKPVTLDKANLAQLLPTLSLPQNIKDAITNAVNQGFIVRVPQSEFSYEDWTGTGYIMERVSTGEAGYMLSGQIAGGMTAITGAHWPSEYWDLISQPYSGSPNTDPNAAYGIYKISSGDLQLGKAGQTLTSPLQVMVLDRQNRPVQNALVTFKTLAGGGTFSNNESAIQITSRRNGIAEINFTLGQRTADNPTYWFEPGYTYSDQVGMNLVDAALMNGTHLKTPFAAYGFPGQPHELRKLYGDGKVENILSFNGLLSVLLVDQYQNPIANKQVVFTAQRAEADAGCFPPNENRDRAMLIQVSDACMQGVPSFAQCSNNGNNIPTSQTIITSPQDAAVQVFLGAIPNAAYKITAQCNGVNPVTFTQHTRDIGACQDPHAPVRMLNVGTIFQSDSFGHSINAAQSGNSLPLNARAYFLLEGDKITDFDLTCHDNNNNPYTKPCKRLDGTRNFQEVAPTQASVDFDGQAGQDLGNGIFRVNYKLPDQPGSYPVRIKANGKLKVRKDNTGCQTSCLIDDPYMLEKDAWTYQPVFSVGFVIPEPIVVMVDEKGTATSDTRIDYTILPASYTAGSAFIFLYKDDVLNTYMPTETKGPGFGIISKGYEFDLSKPYEAEVVLNFRTGVEIRSKRIPIRFESLAVKKTDPAFPDTRLRWDDYYPKLGTKTITISGKDDQGQPFTSGRIQAEVIYPYLGHALFGQVQLIPVDNGNFDNNGEARVRLSAPEIAPPLPNLPDTGLEQIEIKFTYIDSQGATRGSIQGTWKVRNNSNVTMQEVRNGEAVFVYDESAEPNHKGVTAANVQDNDYANLYFDFVQVLLNQVVPRKRSVIGYNLLDEQGTGRGVYNNTVAQVIGTFKEHFRVDNVGKPQGDFMKLLTDYNKTAEIETWRNRIVDKHILIGGQERSEDYLINDNTDGDTGLYELYKNVVQKFVNNVIHLCESYRDNSNPDNDIHGWVSRIDSGVTHVVTGSPQAVSYSFGGRRTVSEFNARVSKHGAPEFGQIQSNNANNPYAAYQQYQANILDAGQNVVNPVQRVHGVAGGGTKKWPGIRAGVEYNTGINQIVANWRCWAYDNWAGIDCNGLMLNALRYADRPGAYAALQELSGAGDQPVLGTSVGNVCVNDTCTSRSEIHSNAALFDVNVNRLFHSANTDLLYYWPLNAVQHTDRSLHKGDFIYYHSNALSHITTVYSDKAELIGNQVRYRIIHAYGRPGYDFNNNQIIDPSEFSRKVVDTRQDIATPIGFGRIKLW